MSRERSSSARWSAADLPDLVGKRAMVTGGSSGIGLETAAALARAGAEVVLTGRDAAKGERAAREIRRRLANAGAHEPRAIFAQVDLADLDAIARFTAAELESGTPLDLLVNNAGVMGLPRRRLTADGFEMQFGINHLGHFALTAQLVPALLRATAPRVVTVASTVHRRATLDLDDLQSARAYDPYRAYGRAKLANLLFALELARRCAASGSRLASIAAHPGFSRTDLFDASPSARVGGLLAAIIGQPARLGALPTLYAATAPAAANGGYYGPTGLGEMTGAPGPARIARQARDSNLAEQLWAESERLTRLHFPALA